MLRQLAQSKPTRGLPKLHRLTWDRQDEVAFFRVIGWLGPAMEKLELYYLMSLNRAAREGCSSGKQYAWFGDGP